MASEQEILDIVQSLRAYAFRIIKNPDLAEDILQTVILKCLENKENIHSEHLWEIKKYIANAIRNTFFDVIRKNNIFYNKIVPRLNIQEEYGANQDDSVYLNEIINIIHSMKSPKNLSNQDILLIIANEDSYKEISENNNISINAVKKKVFGLRQKLNNMNLEYA